MERQLARDAVSRTPPVRRCCGACSQIKLTVGMSQSHMYDGSCQIYYATRSLIAQRWIHTWLMRDGQGQVECQCKKFRDSCYLASHLLYPAGPRLPRATNCRAGAVLHRLLTRGLARAAASCESRRFRARNGHCPWRIFPRTLNSGLLQFLLALLQDIPIHSPSTYPCLRLQVPCATGHITEGSCKQASVGGFPASRPCRRPTIAGRIWKEALSQSKIGCHGNQVDRYGAACYKRKQPLERPSKRSTRMEPNALLRDGFRNGDKASQ